MCLPLWIYWDWEKFNETSLPEKEDLYSHLNMEDITDADYMDTKRVEDFKIKNLGEYHDLYVQSDTLLLAHVFENFRNMSQNIWTWSRSFSYCTWLSMASSFKKDQNKIRSFNWWYVINGRICHSIFSKANNKHMKDYKNKESSYLKTGM